MEDIEVGNVVEGIVTGIEKYGIFVKLNENYCGLIHISQVIDGYVKNIDDFAKVGERIFVEIISVDDQSNKCILSIKNINYRKDGNESIKESIRGFSPLKHHLPIWIAEKMHELHEENYDK